MRDILSMRKNGDQNSIKQHALAEDHERQIPQTLKTAAKLIVCSQGLVRYVIVFRFFCLHIKNVNKKRTIMSKLYIYSFLPFAKVVEQDFFQQQHTFFE